MCEVYVHIWCRKNTIYVMYPFSNVVFCRFFNFASLVIIAYTLKCLDHISTVIHPFWILFSWSSPLRHIEVLRSHIHWYVSLFKWCFVGRHREHILKCTDLIFTVMSTNHLTPENPVPEHCLKCLHHIFTFMLPTFKCCFFTAYRRIQIITWPKYILCLTNIFTVMNPFSNSIVSFVVIVNT